MHDLGEHEFHPLKILHHVDRLRVLAAGGEIAPVTVEIDPVAYCNHACAWCVDPVHRPVTLGRETFEALARELAGFRVGRFEVQGIVLKGGGEPTLHPELGGLVEHAAGLGFAVGVVTNGSRLARWAGVLADRAAYVRISVDGPTPESHALVHRSDDFEEVVQGVRELVARRAGRRHPVLGLSFALDTRTIAHAPAALALGERLGVDYVLLRPPFFEEVGHPSTMTSAEARRVRRQLARAARAYRGPLLVQVGQWVGDVEQAARPPALGEAGRRDLQRTPSLPIEHRTGRCLASPLLAVVTADGTLYGCCNLRALPEWSFGRLDYPRGVGFRTLWEGEQRAAVLARMHRTECIRHCTHPLARYNEMIEVLRDAERPHAQFV